MKSQIINNKIFIIREKGKWVVGIPHSGLSLNLVVQNKNKTNALIELAHKCYVKFWETSYGKKYN